MGSGAARLGRRTRRVWGGGRVGPDGLVHRCRRLPDVTAPTGPPGRTADAPTPTPAPPPPPFEPRQRWRVTFARDLPPGEEVPTGREYIGRWEDTVVAAGLPAVTVASGRPRIALGAPLPSGCSAEGELLEIWLTELRPAWIVREELERALPGGHRLVGLDNVWIGAPALSGQVAAADYVVTLVAAGHDPADIAAAAERLLEADRLPRARQKGGETRIYDLRPLILRLEGRGHALEMRTRIHPELGTGRPDEVVAAVADELGAPLVIERIVRTRLLLAEDLQGLGAGRRGQRRRGSGPSPRRGPRPPSSTSPEWRSRTIVPAPSATKSTSTVLAPGGVASPGASQPHVSTIRVGGSTSTNLPLAMSEPL